MSIHLTSRVWKMEGLQPVAKLILLKLADNANDDGVGWPSVGHICAETGASRSTVQKWVRDFEQAGWLTRTQREDASNIYTLNLPEHPPARQTDPARQTGTPPPDRKAPPARQTGTEPSLNHQFEPSKGFSKKFSAPEAGAAILDELGEAFKAHPVFCLRLGEFVAERFKSGRKMTEEAAHRLAVKFAKHDPETCATALETSLDRGWTGVFPESVKGDQRRGSGGPHLSAQATLGDWGFGEA